MLTCVDYITQLLSIRHFLTLQENIWLLLESANTYLLPLMHYDNRIRFDFNKIISKIRIRICAVKAKLNFICSCLSIWTCCSKSCTHVKFVTIVRYFSAAYVNFPFVLETSNRLTSNIFSHFKWLSQFKNLFQFRKRFLSRKILQTNPIGFYQEPTEPTGTWQKSTLVFPKFFHNRIRSINKASHQN